jgi:alpha-N-arabinofuranosidase
MYYVNRGCDECTQPIFLAMGSSWVTQNGEPVDWAGWNETVINGLITKPHVEYIAMHRYWGQDLSVELVGDRSPEVYLGDWAMHFDDYISTTAKLIDVAKVRHGVRDKPFHIAFTEWSSGTFSHMSTLAGALHFNLFLRHADAVKRSNFTMFTSLLSGSREGTTYRSPFFYMFKAFSTNVRGVSLDALVQSETFDGKMYTDIPYLDVSASYMEADRTMVFNVVNRNMTDAIETEIVSDSGAFSGPAEVSVINAEDVNARYMPQDAESHMPATTSVSASGRSFRYAFAPHSFTQIKVRVE